MFINEKIKTKKQNKIMEESKTFENLLIIDTEGNHELREIGAILWNLRTNETVEFSSHLPHTIEKINEFKSLVQKCDGIVGHIIAYDKSLLKKNNINIDDKISICSCKNFRWPESIDIKSRRLEDICKYFNVSLIDIHTAIGDCRLLKQCLIQVPEYQNRLETAFLKKKTRQRIVQLISNDTKLVDLKNGQTIITQFLKTNGELREYIGKHDDGLIIPCPPTIEIYGKHGLKKSSMENVKKLQSYIANSYPISVKCVRIKNLPNVLFIIGAKTNGMQIVDMDTSAFPQHVFRSNKSQRVIPRKTMTLIEAGVKIIICNQMDNIITQFRLANGGFHKCKHYVTHNSSSSTTIQFPEIIEIRDDSVFIANVEKLKTYIPNHPIRVDRFQNVNNNKNRRNYELLFSIGEPIATSCDMECVETKSESFRIQNQTGFYDNIFLKFLDENKIILPCLQENRLRFAPICLNNTNFILSWNFVTNILEIVQDQS